MGFFDRFKEKPKGLISAPFVSKKSFFQTVANSVFGASGKTQGFDNLATEGYSKNPFLFACVDLRATSFANLPFKITMAGGREVEQHDLFNLLDSAVYNNEKISRFDFLYSLSVFLDLAGEAFIWGDDANKPNELVLLNPADVAVKVIDGKVIYEVGKRKIDREAELFIHYKFFNPSDKVRGLAPASPSALSLDTNNAGRIFNATLMEKHTKIDGVIVGTQGDFDAETKDQFKQDFRQKASGVFNAGEILFMSDGIDYKPMDIKPADMEWSQAMTNSGMEIALAFGVPVELLGTGRNTYENVKEANLGFFHRVVIPNGEKFARMLSAKLLLSEKISVDLEGIEPIQRARQEAKQKELTAKSTHAAQLYQTGIITQNEAREALGLEGLGGGDMVKPSFMMGKEPQDHKAVMEPHKIRSRVFRQREQESMGLFNKVAKEFRQQRRDVIKAYEASKGDVGLFQQIWSRDAADRIESLSVVLNKTKRNIVDRVGLAQLQELHKCYGARNIKQNEVEFMFDAFTESVGNWIVSDTARKVAKIDSTTQRQIGQIVQNGIDEGSSIVEVAEDIDGLFLEQIIPNRSMVIARTEVLPAINFGIVEAGKQSGLALNKLWMATPDDRTRDTHSAMDGAIVGLNDNFNIDGELLGFPADGSLGASAENVIQCRCAVAFVEAKK